MKTLQLSNNVVAIYTKIENTLINDIIFSSKSLSKYIIKGIYKSLGKYIKKHLSYDLFAIGFNQAFFFKNLLKCLIATEYFLSKVSVSFDALLDVGSGAAPASIAIYEFRKNFSQESSTVNVRLVDKSQKQLLIAKRILAKMGIPVRPCVNDSFRIEDVAPNEFVVFSYFVCEQERSFISELLNNKDRFKGGFLIIDYQYVIERIKKLSSQSERKRLHYLSAQVDIPEELRNTFGEDKVVVHGCFFEG